MKYFNCHTHIFNMQYVPENFLSVHLDPRVADAVHWILNKKWLAKGFMAILKPFLKPTGKKTIAFLKIGLLKSQDEVFKELLKQYPKSDDVRFIVLPLNFKYMGAGKLNIPYEQQLLDLFEVKKKFPNRCFPFVAIDPKMGTGPENRDFVAKYIEKGFSGIKMYPAMGFYPYDIRLKEVYEYAQEREIPVLTHCSRGGINYCSTDDMQSMEYPVDLNGKRRHFPYDPKVKLGKYCDTLNSPDQLEEVLMIFPKLKICVAHFGMDNETNIDTFRPDSPDFAWYFKMRSLMEKYENVYADISYTLSHKKFYTWFQAEYDGMSESVKSRILFGTDYFMTVQEELGDENVLYARAVRSLGQSVFERLAYTNILRFLNSKAGTYA